MDTTTRPTAISLAWANFCDANPTDPAIESLAQVSCRHELDPGKFLVQQGDASDSVYLIENGALDIISYTENGHEIWLSEAGPGDLIGEISALTGTKRTSSVRAASPASAISVSRAALNQIMRDHGAVALAVARLLASRLHATSAQVAELVAMSVNSRIYAELIRMGTQDTEDQERVIVKTPISISALGQRVHASRESASRAISRLVKRGLVKRGEDEWIIIIPTDQQLD
ncbi:MAG: Crp/Fnr family transcriptional regulator [Pseudomonadota bacterium]